MKYDFLYGAALLTEFCLLFVLCKYRLLDRNPMLNLFVVLSLIANLGLLILSWQVNFNLPSWREDLARFDMAGEAWQTCWWALAVAALFFAVLDYEDPANAVIWKGMLLLVIITAGSRWVSGSGATRVSEAMSFAVNASFILPVGWMAIRLSNVWPAMQKLASLTFDLEGLAHRIGQYARVMLG